MAIKLVVTVYQRRRVEWEEVHRSNGWWCVRKKIKLQNCVVIIGFERIRTCKGFIYRSFTVFFSSEAITVFFPLFLLLVVLLISLFGNNNNRTN